MLKNIYSNRKLYFYYTFVSQFIVSILSVILVKIAFKLILKFSNQENIDLNNIFKIILKPASLTMIILFILIIAFLIFLEFVFLIILIDDNYKYRKVNIKSIILKTASKLKKCFRYTICLFIYIYSIINTICKFRT